VRSKCQNLQVIELDRLVNDFAAGIERADSRRPQAVVSRTGRTYQAGIGPHPEAATIRLVVDELAALDPAYSGCALNVPYPGASRQRCDWCVGTQPDWDWAVEVKLLRLLGDNGLPNDNMLMHILSPYAEHRSALTDCEKLVHSGLPGRKAIVIFGYDHDEWDTMIAVEAFEMLARRRVALGSRHMGHFDGLAHPVHRRGRVYAWEVAAAATCEA
jgi:hypothetical protein